VKTMYRGNTAKTNTNVVLGDVGTMKRSPVPEIGMTEEPTDIVPPPGVTLRS
jgi:hypothetical protein